MSMRTESEIRHSLEEMERMTALAERMLNNPKVISNDFLRKQTETWRERSHARASILKWVLGLPYLEELPPLMKEQ